MDTISPGVTDSHPLNGVENFIHEWSEELTPDPEYLTDFRIGVSMGVY